MRRSAGTGARAPRALAAISIAALLAGCAGNSATPPTNSGPGAVPDATRRATVRIIIPAPIHPNSATRRPRFVSPSTDGVLVNVYAHSDTLHQTSLGTSATDVSSGSSACGGTVGTPRACTVAIPAPPGNDDFVFTTYDVPPSGGSFNGAIILAVGLVTQTIGIGQSNVVSVTLGGVVNRVSVALPTPFIRGTQSSTQTLTVAALDGAGNVIVTDAYMDLLGNPVTIALSAAPNPNTEIALGTATLSAPSQTGVTVTYNGAATASYASVITATASSGPTASATLTLLGPAAAQFLPPTSSPGTTSIASGPDGNLWFTEASHNAIARSTTAGTITEFALPNPNSGPNAIAAGPDGNLWFTESSGVGKVGRITPTGTITEFPIPTANSVPGGIAAGADGNLWFVEQSGNSIARITPSGTVTEFGLGPGRLPYAIAAGPDGNLWFTEGGMANIGRMTTGGVVAEFAVPGGKSPYQIAAGADGNLWFTTVNYDVFGRVTTAGAVTMFPIPTLNSSPQAIAPGPDGNIWFVEGAINKIARVTPAGAVTEYALGFNVGNQHGLVTGVDGNLWLTNSFAIGRFQW
jgi:streptogramin lyase